MRPRSLRRFARVLLFAGLLGLLAACSGDAPMSGLYPEGPVARRQLGLFKPVFWIAAAIFFIVEGLVIYAVIKFRDRPGREEPKQIHGNHKLEFTWTLIPALILLGVAIPTVVTIFDLEPRQDPDELTIRVTGYQWWWRYDYVGTDPLVFTANEMVVPRDRTITLELVSQDVIHSFWVPKLFGKQDVVPNRTNKLQFTADTEGEYYGQCAEFCAISHANMRMRVHVVSPQEFERWLERQQEPVDVPTSGDAAAGAALFANTELLGGNTCINCHTVAGLDNAVGITGPNLTHFARRGTFGAATFDLTEENLFDWIKNPREMKPGVVMPPFEGVLTDQQIRQIVAFLMTLR